MTARYRIYSGPIAVGHYAEALRGVDGVSDVLEGTEHVHCTYTFEPEGWGALKGESKLREALKLGVRELGRML